MTQSVTPTIAPHSPVEDILVDAEDDALPTSATPGSATVLLGASLVLIAFNLRPVFSSTSVLLAEISAATGLSSFGASVLTTMPVLCLGVFAPFAPRLAQRIGAERVLLGVVAFLALGTVMRGLGSALPLFAGTALAGACIALGNVLLPGVVKRDFPRHSAIMTGLYTMALCGGAAAGAGLTVPIERALGGSWALALMVWAVPAVLVTVIWLPQALRSTNHDAHRVGHRVTGLWRDPLAWQVTLFMGLQSSLAYCVFGWLAPMLRERGLDPAHAGAIASVSIIVQVVTCLFVPSIAVRRGNQSMVNVVLVACAVIGLIGLLLAPIGTVWLWAVIQGIGQGGLIAAAMMVIVLRSQDSHIASHLSGMAQCVGYILAATGPLLVGLIHGYAGNFRATIPLFLALGLCAGIAGWKAGRDRHVGAHVSAP